MATNILLMPQVAEDLITLLGNTQLSSVKFNKKLHMYDAQDNETSAGFTSKTELTRVIIASTPANMQIALSPTTQTDTEDFSINVKFIKNITNYNQRNDDPASSIFSQERPVYLIDKDIDVRDKAIFFTQETIYTEDDKAEIDPQIPVFLIDSYSPIYNNDGVFQYGILVLKKLQSFQGKKTSQIYGDGGTIFEYITYLYFKISVQPLNVRRMRLTFKSKPIIWNILLKGGESNTSLDLTLLNPDKWAEEIFLPSISGNKVRFSPSFAIEKSFYEWGLSHREINGDIFPSITSTLENSVIGEPDSSYMEIGYMAPTYKNDGMMNFAGKKNGRYAFPSDNSESGIANTGLPSDEGIEPNYYSSTKIVILNVIGFGISANDMIEYMFSKSEEILNYIPPISLSGVKGIATSPSTTDGAQWPRKAEQKSAVWITNKEECLWIYDYVFHSELLGIVGTGSLNSYATNLNGGLPNNKDTKEDLFDLGSMPDWIGNYTPYLNSEKQRQNKSDLLQGNLEWMGISFNNFPPAILSSSFDFSIMPKDWDLNEMKTWLGLFPTDDINNPANIDEDSLKERAINTPISATAAVDLGLGETMALLYKNFVNIKGQVMMHDFYKNENGEYVIELEAPENVSGITQFEMWYFGGYERKEEFFQNSKAEAEINGDKYCIFTFNGIEYDLPPSINTADNILYDPRTIKMKKVYGNSTGTLSQQILKQESSKEFWSNKKKILNWHTGKMIKNPRYKKGGHNE